jgi:hypothetical protein
MEQGKVPHDWGNNKTCVNHEADKRTRRENEAKYAKHEIGPTHAQLVRTALKRG